MGAKTEGHCLDKWLACILLLQVTLLCLLAQKLQSIHLNSVIFVLEFLLTEGLFRFQTTRYRDTDIVSAKKSCNELPGMKKEKGRGEKNPPDLQKCQTKRRKTRTRKREQGRVLVLIDFSLEST